jgi:hypothetical protein
MHTSGFLWGWGGVQDWGLNSELHTCKAGTLPLEVHLWSICSSYFGGEGLSSFETDLELWLTLNHDFPSQSP